MLLPSEPPSLTLSPKMNTETSPSSSSELPTQIKLPALRPLFFPPPFTPSHPIFVHLASIANEESQNLRAAAEQRIADFVKAETASIEAGEQSLRHQVEVFWTTYKDHLNALQGESSKPTMNVPRPHVSHNGFGPGVLGAAISSSAVSIRNFDPVPITPPLLSPLSSGPRTSALSASLATSTFRHLSTNEARTNSSGYSGSASSHTLSSTYSKSPTFISDAVPMANSNVLQYKRNINGDINTQASYRYFINLEEDMARYKRNQEIALKAQQDAEAEKQAQQAPTQVGSSDGKNGNVKHNKTVGQATKPQTNKEDGSARVGETVSPGERDMGKRKVTFEAEPTVMAIKTEVDGKVEEDATNDQDSGGKPIKKAVSEILHFLLISMYFADMLFSLEDLEGEGYSSGIQHSTPLPLVEQPVSRPLRARTTRSQNNIEIFSSLRPSSLPNPSHIRPLRGQPHVDSSSHVMLPRPTTKVLNTPTSLGGGSRSPPLHHGSSPQIPTEHDAELLRLVAADTPSHRGAWAPNSRAWRTFIRRQDLKEGVDRNGRILEEGEETEETDSDEERSPVVTRDHLPNNGTFLLYSLSLLLLLLFTDYFAIGYSVNVSHPISCSVPINIVVRNQQPEPLNLASYRPKTNATPTNQQQPRWSNGDVPPSSSLPHGQKMLSSTSIRKAKYAERDRARAVDPGALEFATIEEEEGDEEEDEDEDDEDEDEEKTLTNHKIFGERGRKLALKILKARNELPEDGT